MSPWLGRHMDDSVALYAFPAPEIRRHASNDQLWPSEGIVGPKAAFKRHIPYEIIVVSLAFASVLRLAGELTVFPIPVISYNEVILTEYGIPVVELDKWSYIS